ncbi:MAG: metallophosphoesterase [Fervidicoccaceae archaeon]|nr:MAG: phosphoesterase [Fervidicoccus fontis]
MITIGEIDLIPGMPAVIHRASNVAIIADLHLGFEEEMAKAGIYLPRLQLSRALSLIEYLKSIGVKKLIIDGDIKNSFNKLTVQEREEIIKFLGKAKDLFDEVVLVRGNHDNYVSIITDKMDVKLVPNLRLSEKVFVLHGHRESSEALKHELIIIGHEHPSLSIRDEIGSIFKLPCFLRVPLKGSRKREILVLPAAGYYQSGNSISLDPTNYLSPLIKNHGNIMRAVPIVIDMEGKDLLEFPPLGAMEELVREKI